MGSGRQSLSALGSTGIDDGTTRFGAHAGTKTMTSLALYIAGLKCSLTHLLDPLVGAFIIRKNGRHPVIVLKHGVNQIISRAGQTGANVQNSKFAK